MVFHFKGFSVQQSASVHKVGTDGVLLAAWAAVEDARSVLDIGTGTGLIALMTAQRTDDTCILTAIDTDPDAVRLTAENFKQSPWANRLRVEHIRLQDFQSPVSFDHILSNPPYFLNSLAPPDPKRKVQRHSDALPFEDLVQNTRRLLAADGKWSVVLPFTESQVVEQLALRSGFQLHRDTVVYPKESALPNRRLLEFVTRPVEKIVDQLILMQHDGSRHPQYQALTNNFYLRPG